MEHSHTDKKKVLDRLSRAIGHLEAIRRMVEEDRDCSEVLVQIAAVRTAVNNVGRIILLDHINHCIVHAVENGDQKALDDLNTAVNRFVK
ncbi:MAG: metal-sensing transcriptional repressor [Butyricicoccus pullicaecorum]|nr:metal-sensing transcriptional repressor [Butyricicoccus pullicaecorum]